MLPMPLWQAASLVFFIYVLVIVGWRGARTRVAALQIAAGSMAGVAVVLISMLDVTPAILRDVILPPVVLLTGYWTSGLLFVAPSAAQERALAYLDNRLDILGIARRAPRFVAELLEAAYLGIYGLVGIALLLHYLFVPRPDPARFWSVILVTDFVCFAFLPWVQTRPPRAIENVEPWTSSIRSWNLRLLGSASIQANTFPSGHAAEGLAAGLLVLGAPAPIPTWMIIAGVLVAAGAVLGRYHYLVDALAGFVVALVVWSMI